MPSDRRKQNPTKYKNKPWHARVKYRGIEYSFGYHETYEEALAAEQDFRSWNPSTSWKNLLPPTTTNTAPTPESV